MRALYFWVQGSGFRPAFKPFPVRNTPGSKMHGLSVIQNIPISIVPGI